MENMEAIIYGSISVTIVSLLSLGGAVIAPLIRSDTKHRWLHFFIAMAVSTLSSDAILHIIPQIVGIHNHSHNHTSPGHVHGHGHSHDDPEHDHDHDHDHHEHNSSNHNHAHDNSWYEVTNERMILLRLSLVVLSIYVLYFFEFITFYRNPEKSATDNEISTKTSESSESNNNDYDDGSTKRLKTGHELVSIKDHDESGTVCGLRPRALIILFGDGVHNFVDGVAIGASFLVSIKLGCITSIAVMCHELPHEIGDLAVLVDSGLSMCTALILNLLSALTAYIGLYFSILIGKNEGVENILLAITGGMFLYVAWVDMLSHLKHERSSQDHWFLTCSIQFLGFLVGFILIFALGWFEDSFSV